MPQGETVVTQSHPTERTSRETTYPHLRHRRARASPPSPRHSPPPTPHPLQPNAPRTVTVSEADTPPVVRAGLLQSTLILLPAEEKVATVFGGDTVDWVFDGGHVASRFHQRQAQGRQRARPTSTSSRTTATSTPCSFARCRATAIPTSTPRCSSCRAIKPPKTGWPSCPSSCLPPSWTRRSRKQQRPRRPQTAELKAEDTKAETVPQPVSRQLAL